MKLNLQEMLKALAWPLGLVAVFSAVLALFGIELATVMTIAGTMIGAQALFSLLIDVLKWAGAVADGDAGKWSAALNLLGIVGISVALYFYPAFDFPKLDSTLMIVAQFLSVVFGYIVQLIATKRMHQLSVRGLGVRAFSYQYAAK